MSARLLFLFGYESPDEFRSNSAYDSDFESSAGVWIANASEDESLCWGRVIAQHFVTWLFERVGEDAYSWADAQFANWIDTDPSVLNAAVNRPVVAVGEMPDFADLRRKTS